MLQIIFYGCLHNLIYASTEYLKMNFDDVYKKIVLISQF